ncbi:MAG: FAD-binding protein [Streptosporangiales bacterium]|nr:FAD-binding protein [Streptosporangiales bacterium]
MHPREEALAALAKACEVSGGSDADAVDGIVPDYVARPDSVESAAEVMRAAAERGLRVVPRGAGTKLDWGSPPAGVDLVVDTGRLDRVLEHAAGDLVVRVQSGLTLGRLQVALAAHGQELALDEPVLGSTVGGMLATGTSGPRRLLHGGPRDLLIGITVVRADGMIARSGGKVVKNVAGYDLGKLFTGSYGTLGLIVEAIFRLHPLPAASQVVTWTAPDEGAAHERLQALLHSQLVPAAVEIDRPAPDAPIAIGVLLEGVAEGVTTRAEAAARLLGNGFGGADGAEVGTKPPAWWGRHPTDPDGVLVKLAAEVSALPHLLAAVARAARSAGLTPAVRGSAGGLLHVGLPVGTEPAAAAEFLAVLRPAVARHDGSAVVLHAPRAVRDAVDVWGPVPALGLMGRLKDQFDPQHRLAPGRFVGGI